MIEDFDRFQDELDPLRELFCPAHVNKVLPRLREIYDYTEEKWRAYAEQIPSGLVRYVLIAEAPPWSEKGPPPFWLDPDSGVRLGALRYVFCQTRLGSYADVLEAAAERGFLLLESIPFAMKYTSSKRLSPRYGDLLKLTVKTYLQAKANASGLSGRLTFVLRSR